MKLKNDYSIMFIICIIIPEIVYATIIMISPGESIQLAVNSSQDGDTLILADGYYNESVILYGKRLTIGSEFVLDSDTSHIAATIVAGPDIQQDTASCFVYCYNEPLGSHLMGLTLQDGSGTLWSAIGYPIGGAIYLKGSRLNVANCIIRGSTAIRGGGIAAIGNTNFVIGGQLVLQNTHFENCLGLDNGGGVYAYFCSLAVNMSEFIADTCLTFGGGLDCRNSYVEIDSIRVRHCSGLPGGVYISESTGFLRNSMFEENGGRGDHGQTHLIVSNQATLISGNLFRNNSTPDVSISLFGSPAPKFIGNVVENNLATNRTGTVLVGYDGNEEFAYNIIRNNINIIGGAIQSFQMTQARIHHNIVEGNISQATNSSSAFACVSNCASLVDSNIFRNNSGVSFGFYFQDDELLIDARNNWWGHESGPYHQTQNPFGQGDTIVSDSVLFIPWLTSPPDTTMPSGINPRPTIPATWELVSVYPNPFNSSVRIVIAGFAAADFEVKLYNTLGQLVATIHQGLFSSGELHYTADPAMAGGVYFLRLSDKSHVRSKKIVFLK